MRRAVAGRPFVEWTPQGPSVYNPYARGSETEIADKALAGERFTEPHYLRQAQRYLGHAVRALRRSGLEVSLQVLVEHLDPARLELLARTPARVRRAGGARLPGLAHHAPAERSDGRARPSGDPGRVRRRTLARSADARRGAVRPAGGGAKPGRSCTSAWRPTAGRCSPRCSGRRSCRTCRRWSRRCRAGPWRTLVVIDEFSAIAAGAASWVCSAERVGAGVSLVLGTQELSDLRLPGREMLLEQVVGNLSTLIAHRQVVPASAELIASMTETRGVWRTSHHSSGSARLAREVSITCCGRSRS